MVLLSQKFKGCYRGSSMIVVNIQLFYHGSSCVFWQLLLLLCHDYCTILWCWKCPRLFLFPSCCCCLLCMMLVTW